MTTGGSDMELKTEILIIGGGASGMAAARPAWRRLLQQQRWVQR